LQTAAAAISELNHIRTIHVHHGLGEAQHEVLRCLRNTPESSEFVRTGISPLYLTHQGKRDAIDNQQISLVDVDIRHENDDEYGGFDTRFMNTLRHIIDAHQSGDILIVTHGVALNAVGNRLVHPVLVYSIDYCGVLVVDLELQGVLHQDRLELLSEH
jgi:broad specificity phosphatase PhoE